MPLSLYSATVPSYLQLLGATAGLVEKAEAWCAERQLPADDIIQARLAADMLPFAYQVKSVGTHSFGAIEALRAGQYVADLTPPPRDFAGLKAALAHAVAGLQGLKPSDVDDFMGREVVFVFGERRMPFVAEEFLLSFSQPNFYFHATTAYDILRWKGLPVGKKDFVGRLRLKARS